MVPKVSDPNMSGVREGGIKPPTKKNCLEIKQIQIGIETAR